MVGRAQRSCNSKSSQKAGKTCVAACFEFGGQLFIELRLRSVRIPRCRRSDVADGGRMPPVYVPPDFFDLQSGDEHLTADELAAVPLFAPLKTRLARFPGTTVLRHARPGRFMCEQGEAGASAFYILAPQDLLELFREQIKSTESALEVENLGVESDSQEIPAWLGSLRPSRTGAAA